MMKRILVFLLGAVLFQTAFGCGGGSGTVSQTPLTATDNKLAGQWYAERVSANGDRITLAISPGPLGRQVSVIAVHPAGDTSTVTDGTYKLDGSKLHFTLSGMPEWDAPFTVNDSQLTLGTDVYHRFLLSGPRVGGRVQVTEASADDSVSSLTVSSVRSPNKVDFVPCELLVKYKNSPFFRKVKIGCPEPDQQALSIASEHPNEAFGAVLAAKSASPEATLRAQADFESDPNVESVTTNAILRVQAVPNDPLYGEEWAFATTNMPGVWGLVDNPEAGVTHDVVVAVIDTGIVSDHPDLTGRVLLQDGYDWVADDISGLTDHPECNGDFDMDETAGEDHDASDPGDMDPLFPDGNSWHGTHIAAEIAALRNNSAGIAGENPHARILPLRACGRCGNCDLDAITDAVLYAAHLPSRANCDMEATPDSDLNDFGIDESTCDYGDRPKAQVINLSLGERLTASQADPLCKAISQAIQNGVVVISAAGNTPSNDTYYPAACPGVISVGSVYPNLSFAAQYSSYGSHQFLVAGGGSSTAGIVSAVSETVNVGFGSGYGSLVGTSQAAAFVSGVASLLFSAHPDLTPTQIKDYLKATAFDLGPTGWDEKYGWGLVNPLGALEAVTGFIPPAPSSLALSSESIDFGRLGTSSTVLVFNSASCSGLSVSSDSDWLSASLTTTTVPVHLSIGVSRTGLSAGNYTGNITLNSSCGSKTIQASARVGVSSLAGGGDDDGLKKRIEDFLSGSHGTDGGPGDPGSSGDAIDLGEVELLLVDANSGDAKAHTTTDLNADYYFQFLGIAPGDYHLIWGIDENGNGTICGEEDLEEPCFVYRNMSDPEVIHVTDSTQINDLELSF